MKDGSRRHHLRTTLKLGTEPFKGFMTEKISEINDLCDEAHKEAQLAVINSILNSNSILREQLGKLSQANEERERLKDLKQSASRFLEWLKQVPVEDDLRELSEEHQQEGTCEWIEDDATISTWLDIKSAGPYLLWMSGEPGTGKSVLCAHMINQLKNRYPTAYFFCKKMIRGSKPLWLFCKTGSGSWFTNRPSYPHLLLHPVMNISQAQTQFWKR